MIIMMQVTTTIRTLVVCFHVQKSVVAALAMSVVTLRNINYHQNDTLDQQCCIACLFLLIFSITLQL